MRLVLLLLGIRFIFSSYVNHDRNEEIITWQEGRALTWNDFRGVPEKRNSVASTYYNINTSVTNHKDYCTVGVTAIFFPTLSWKQKDRDDKIILIHEQRHFDISELFARKLRKRIKGEKFKSFAELESRIEVFYEQNDKAMEACQEEYDRQTDHSRNGLKQREWNRRIEQALNALKDYKDSTVRVVFNNFNAGQKHKGAEK
jgi:hypothetical protein